MKSVKRIVLLAILNVAYVCAFSQPLQFNANNPVHTDTNAILALNIKTDFGAVGDSVTSDQLAFEAASEFINSRKGYCKLTIPAGTYRVGRQFQNSLHYRQGKDALRIIGCANVEISGTGNPVLKYNDNMKYGYFDPVTGAPFNPTDHWVEANTWASMGNCIYIYNASPANTMIKVSGLTLDGNMYPGKVTIGGHIGDINIQIEHYGIYIYGAGNVLLENIVSQRFGLDGFIIRNNPSNSNHHNVELRNCHADYNTRQGISIIGGRHITLNNSSFNNTGMGIMATNPMCGVDIESEKEHTTNMVWKVLDVTMNNCVMNNNKNSAIALTSSMTDSFGNKYGSSFRFNNCSIYASQATGTAIDLGHYKDILFNKCDIVGPIYDVGNGAQIPADGVRFISCHISDLVYKSYTDDQCIKVKNYMPASSSVVYSTKLQQLCPFLVFDSCTFDLHRKRFWNIYASSSAPARITNCTVKTSSDIPYGGDYTKIGFDSNVVFQNNHFYFHDFQEYNHVENGVYHTSPNIPGITFHFYNFTTALPPQAPDTIHGTSVVINGQDSCIFGTRPTAIDPLPSSTHEFDIAVYPNPAINQEFTLENKTQRLLSYAFFDLKGKLIEQGTIQKSQKKQMRYPQLTTGIYFLKINNEKTTQVKKVVLK